ncbi:UNVERIFIED_CONTAM: hypothetical protein Sradi_5114700 [Sesamum radiatum]|uniref:Uncharacterized protein n=1 Tax=Sesamum radiatum TaxID=300843 RepID=A0AAW2M213_SESRA
MVRQQRARAKSRRCPGQARHDHVQQCLQLDVLHRVGGSACLKLLGLALFPQLEVLTSSWLVTEMARKRVGVERGSCVTASSIVGSRSSSSSLDILKSRSLGACVGASPLQKKARDTFCTSTSATIARGGIFTTDVSQACGIQLNWDPVDIFLAWNRMRNVVREDDLWRFSTLSDK